MDKECKTIVWFRRDLRIEDNPALYVAAKSGPILLVYIWCPKEEGQFYPGRVSRWWLKQSLANLDASLRSLGIGLVLMKAQSSFDALIDCVNVTGATKVVFNNLYDPISLVRDQNIKEKLVEFGISVETYNGDLLLEPWEIRDHNSDVFTHFDPYWDKCLSTLKELVVLPPPRLLVPLPVVGVVEGASLDELGLEDAAERPGNALLGEGWSPGWVTANKVLDEFVGTHLISYSAVREKVSGKSTSILSPYLHFGELSVRKVFGFVREKQAAWEEEGDEGGRESGRQFLRGVGLREYSRYLCYHFPVMHEVSVVSRLRYFPWNTDEVWFKAWRQGRTGYPLVDAGMRQLWATGWTHNRVRVVVASFFVRFLLLPWRWGMKFFWDTLIDADLENDILGWQYVSGSLPDGHLLHRIDHPQVQGSKYDPDGRYVRQWLPELARMPAEWIHHPWDAPLAVLKAAGVELGFNYPKPIVGIGRVRERLTRAIHDMLESEAAAESRGRAHLREEVLDNSGGGGPDEERPVDVSDDLVPCLAGFSNDQMVPVLYQGEEGAAAKKRAGCEGYFRHFTCYTPGASNTDEDLLSTANSPLPKRQATGLN